MRRVGWWLVLLGGCITRTPAPDPDESDGAMQVPGDATAPGLSVYDPRARVRAGPVAEVFQPTDGQVMQGGDHQLLGLDDRYALLWLLNVSGRIHLVGRTWQSGRLSDLRFLTGDEPGEPRSPDQALAVWRRGELVVFTTVDGGLWMRRYDVDLTARGPIVPILPDREGEHLSVRTARPSGDGFVLVGGRSSQRYLPVLIRLSADGALQGEPTVMLEEADYPAVGDLWEVADGFRLLWSQRRAAEPDTLHLSAHDAAGRLTPPITLLHESEDAILQPLHLPEPTAPRVVLLRDLDRGLILLRIGQDPLEFPAITDSVVGVHAPDAPQIGLAVAEGTWQAQNPLPTQVMFRAVDHETDQLGPALAVSEADGSCLEAFSLAALGDRLGVAWAVGCSERRLFFREIEVW